VQRFLPPNKRQDIEKNFHQYGIWVLLFARFLPTIRSPIFIMAGTMRISFARFVTADGIYAVPGVSLLFFLAYWFGDTFRSFIERAEQRVSAARPILIMPTGDPRQELPVIGGQVAAKVESSISHSAAPNRDGGVQDATSDSKADKIAKDSNR
jgi:hypothetical protein